MCKCAYQKCVYQKCVHQKYVYQKCVYQKCVYQKHEYQKYQKTGLQGTKNFTREHWTIHQQHWTKKTAINKFKLNRELLLGKSCNKLVKKDSITRLQHLTQDM